MKDIGRDMISITYFQIVHKIIMYVQKHKYIYTYVYTHTYIYINDEERLKREIIKKM